MKVGVLSDIYDLNLWV